MNDKIEKQEIEERIVERAEYLEANIDFLLALIMQKPHITIAVSNTYKDSLAFYEKLLGMEPFDSSKKEERFIADEEAIIDMLCNLTTPLKKDPKYSFLEENIKKNIPLSLNKDQIRQPEIVRFEILINQLNYVLKEKLKTTPEKADAINVQIKLIEEYNQRIQPKLLAADPKIK